MNRFVILMYHMVSEPRTAAEKRYACPPQQFDAHLKMLSREGFNVISGAALADFYMHNLPLPKKSVLITLDDGFEDNYTQAFPLLKAYHFTALIYLITGLIGQTNEWMSEPEFSKRKLLSWSQIKEMAAYGITFGSHTVSHPKLNELDNNSVSQQLSQSKQTIEDHLGGDCLHFAYPYGLLNEDTPAFVQHSQFKIACTTRSGFNDATRDPLMLHRIEVYGTDSAWTLKQKITFGTNETSIFFPLRYYFTRLLEKFGLTRHGY